MRGTGISGTTMAKRASMHRIGTAALGQRIERLSQLEGAFCVGGYKHGCPRQSFRLSWVRQWAEYLKARWFDAYHDEMESRQYDELLKRPPERPVPTLVKRFKKHARDEATMRAEIAARQANSQH